MDALSGEYKLNGKIEKAEDKNQSYRRFPFFIVLHEEDYDLGMNKGVFDGTREFTQYMMYRGLQTNMRRIANRCGNNHELYDAKTGMGVKPIVDRYDDLKVIMAHQQQGTNEEIDEEFKDLGKQFGDTVLYDAETGKEEVIIPAVKNDKNKIK